MQHCKTLPNLHTAAMPMHVAESTNIHKNVKAEFLTTTVGAQHLIVFATMPQAQIDDLPLHFDPHRVQLVSHLTI